MALTTMVITSGNAAQIPTGIQRVCFKFPNPGVLRTGNFALTLPALPLDGDEITIFFGEYGSNYYAIFEGIFFVYANTSLIPGIHMEKVFADPITGAPQGKGSEGGGVANAAVIKFVYLDAYKSWKQIQ